MIDPPHVDITTRMPKFSQDGKTTPLRDVLDGDAFRQYVIDGRPVGDVAKELGLRPGTVYSIKCKVLSRLRQELRNLLD